MTVYYMVSNDVMADLLSQHGLVQKQSLDQPPGGLSQRMVGINNFKLQVYQECNGLKSGILVNTMKYYSFLSFVFYFSTATAQA